MRCATLCALRALCRCDWEQLVDAKGAAQATSFCLVNGTADSYVDRRKNERMLAPLEDVYWHWEEGLGHDFPESWYAVALGQIKRMLSRDDGSA